MVKRGSLHIQKAVVFALVLREVRGRFSENRLGAFWFVFEPVCYVATLIAIHAGIRAQKIFPGIDPSLFFIIGTVPFLLYKNIALKGMEAVSANQGLFAYRQIKPFDCIVARAIVEFSMMSCVYIVLMFVLGFFGEVDISIRDPLAWLFALAIGMALSLGMALIFCVVAELLPEVKVFIKLSFWPLYLLSGALYPLWRLPPQILSLLEWNPFLHIIDVLRAATFQHYPKVPGINIVYPAGVTLVILFCGLMLYRLCRLKMVAI